MTQVVGGAKPAIIITDATVLIKSLRIGRIDRLACRSRDFLATDPVASEITDRYPKLQQRFAAALETGAIPETRVIAREWLRLLASLRDAGRLGAGECSAIALAVHRGYIPAIDDRLAANHAHRADATR